MILAGTQLGYEYWNFTTMGMYAFALFFALFTSTDKKMRKDFARID